MKTELGKCKKLLDSGFSLVCVGENKVPNFAWKDKQTKAYSKEDFEKHYNYSGGIFKKDGTEIIPTNGIGIITGYENIEVVDVDLKVFKSLKEQQDFWNEYIGFLKDNIDDFDDKFVIYKTVNNGYHIIYRCSVVGGNVKIAVLKGQKEAVIETRGIGGYVFIYDNQISKKSYYEVQEISVAERACLFECSRYFNHVEEKDELIPEKIKKESHGVDVSVWDDYNEKTAMLDVIGNDFKVIKRLSNKYVIKREGATSAHSGYIFKDTGCMYLFSTGTIFPHEKLISPFTAYTIKYHNGDFSKSAKELYQKGFGSRIVKKIEPIELPIQIKNEELIFPIDIFPVEIQNYMIKCHETLDSSIDYMGASMLWLISVIVGNSVRIEVKPGWEEPGATWISVLGKAGIGKTPSIHNIVNPIMKVNNREVKNYIKSREKYDAYMSLDKKERQDTEEIKKPVKTQFIAMDITLEALVDLHEENKNAVGVFKDELAGWFKDMNKYRTGSDLEFWLSSWSGKSVFLNRKTAKSSFVESPLIPVLGGIQPRIMDQFYTDENKDNGFIDRMLLCLPDLSVDDYNEESLDYVTINWYSDYIVAFYDSIKRHVISYNIENEIEPIIARFSLDAKVEWKRIFNDITAMQNSDMENEYMKSMLPKQKSYIPRFALLINTLNAFNKSGSLSDFNTISQESILGAERLSKYFIAMARKIKINSLEVNLMKKSIKANDSKNNEEKFIEMYKLNPNLNKAEAAELLGVSRNMIYKYMKKV